MNDIRDFFKKIMKRRIKEKDLNMEEEANKKAHSERVSKAVQDQAKKLTDRGWNIAGHSLKKSGFPSDRIHDSAPYSHEARDKEQEEIDNVENFPMNRDKAREESRKRELRERLKQRIEKSRNKRD